ncbi:hypothetical protein FKV24_002390 [Lysobacter maris]|uniref:Uncharacterized protein n=1 Tax=Marilutibacter maris TaxID=1605891 RepID=A0A508B1Q4_9GAMM|nr:hypothetical protein FKV24_002390 [Lysobacter maris]
MPRSGASLGTVPPALRSTGDRGGAVGPAGVRSRRFWFLLPRQKEPAERRKPLILLQIARTTFIHTHGKMNLTPFAENKDRAQSPTRGGQSSPRISPASTRSLSHNACPATSPVLSGKSGSTSMRQRRNMTKSCVVVSTSTGSQSFSSSMVPRPRISSYAGSA